MSQKSFRKVVAAVAVLVGIVPALSVFAAEAAPAEKAEPKPAQKAEPNAPPKAGLEAVLGEWNLKYSIQDRDIECKLTISKNQDGTLAGKWETGFGENVVSNVKFEGGKLTLSRKTKVQDREFESTFEGTVAGNQMTGMIKSEMGEIPASGTRAAPTVKIAIAGKWELTTTSDAGTRTRILTINNDMTGTYQMRDGDVPIKDLKLDGSKLSFKAESAGGDQTFTMEFAGEVSGDTLKGQFTTPRGTRDVTGKKVAAEAGK